MHLKMRITNPEPSPLSFPRGLRYFTSGTTAKPKLVLHTHQSYPVGHLSTMYWIGLRVGDLHWNISSPGWAKHAWSSFFAPWNAGATVFSCNYSRIHAKDALGILARLPITSLCAPPTVWRMLVQEDLAAFSVHLREAVSAGEPLNPEVIERVRVGWGITIRDGFGQTETTAVVGNSPGHVVKPGSMGRPLPGYRVELSDEGEICLDLAGSPFELESMLIQHAAVAEAAVVPSPDPLRLAVPKAYVLLAAGYSAGPEVARSIFAYLRQILAPYKRIRRLQFAELPKTISGKIRRVQLRQAEQGRSGRMAGEYFEDKF
jgi:acetyl-CoA synthetase